MASSTQILRALVAAGVRINPAAYDFIFPQGPERFAVRDAAWFARFRHAELAGLNPQPVPPSELEIGAGLFQEVLRSAIAGAGTDGPDAVGKFLLMDIEDWCGTYWPRKWPKPRPKLDLKEVLLGASLAAAELGVGYDGPLAETLDQVSGMLADAAIG